MLTFLLHRLIVATLKLKTVAMKYEMNNMRLVGNLRKSNILV